MEAKGSLHKFESIVEKIASKKPELTRERIMEMVERKREEAKSLLNLEGAAFLVAADLGVPLLEEELATKVEIEDVIPNLGDITLTGRVLTVYPLREFSRPDGFRGKLRRILIGDRTGTLEVYLWNEKADEVTRQNIQQNTVVKVAHAYSRKSLGGKVELHIRERGMITALPAEAAGSIPPFEDFFRKVRELKRELAEFNLTGRVTRIHPVRHFSRPEGEGKVLRLTLGDETGYVNVAVWNEKVDEAGVVNVGDQVEVVRGVVKENTVGELEVHVNKRSRIRVFPQEVRETLPTPTPIPEGVVKVAQIKPGMTNLVVEGLIVGTPILREVTLKDGRKVKVADFMLRDETGEVRVSAWRGQAERLSSFSPGTKVRLKNVTSKTGLNGRTELATGDSTVVEALNPLSG